MSQPILETHGMSLRALICGLVSTRHLVWQLTRREVIGRYRGSVLGLAWSFFHPILMLLVYTFVFGIVFKARWTTQGESTAEFALILFSGLLVFNVFSECITRAPALILGNVSYVKKIVFPLHILPCVVLGSALFHGAISLVVWAVFYLVFIGVPPQSAVWFPVLVAPLVLLSLGASWFLCALGVFLRDIAQFIGVVATALMFLSPIFYPLTAIPEAYRPYMYVNPITLIIEQTRDVLILGEGISWIAFLVYSLFAGLVAWGGFAFFQKARNGFADVL